MVETSNLILEQPRMPSEVLGHFQFASFSSYPVSVSDQGTAVIMVTHNLSALQSYPGIVYRCENNRLYEVGENYNISKTSDNEK